MQLKPFEVSEFYILEQRELKDNKGRGHKTPDQREGQSRTPDGLSTGLSVQSVWNGHFGMAGQLVDCVSPDSMFLPWSLDIYIHWVICSVSWLPYTTSLSTVSSLQNPQVSTWENCNFLFENCQSILSLISLQTEVSDFESLQTCYSVSEWIFI